MSTFITRRELSVIWALTFVQKVIALQYIETSFNNLGIVMQTLN